MQHLTHEELHKLLTEAKRQSERNWLMLLIAYWHGLRATEVVNLRADNFTDKDITVRRLHGSGKTTQPLIRHPQALLNEGGWPTFPVQRNYIPQMKHEGAPPLQLGKGGREAVTDPIRPAGLPCCHDSGIAALQRYVIPSGADWFACEAAGAGERPLFS